MYAVKIQRFDSRAKGRDVAQPWVIETVGSLEERQAALAYAQMWQRHETVAAVWIEADVLYN